ncbi:ABC transporter substrate-binding protein [Natronobiforma cellulositropha]|uniref:ABC transporter substrate-binding protein n=1 Tax=Natronobiforma cellulositropha TaxID=1679076 RepID=UPI0021D5CE3E|nr:ABC transporter substrate-binding protein [Natronobiforma cellulositropha]
MRKGDSTRHRGGRLSRRQYAQLFTGASITALAGCLDELGDITASGDGNGDGGENGDDGGERQTRLRLHINNDPFDSNVNPWSPDERNTGMLWFTELTAPMNLLGAEAKLDGHTWEATWTDAHDEVSVPTLYTGYDVDPPYDIYRYFNEEPLTYWDGTPIDAEAKYKEDLLYHYVDSGEANESTFTNQTDGEFTYHSWSDTGRNEFVLASEAATTHDTPVHPDFTQPYIEEFEDAGSEAAYEDVASRLAEDRISFADLAENGWGSGLYELDPDQITDDRMVAHRRDDHPNDHAVVEELEFRLSDTDRFATLANDGRIDLGAGIVHERGGNINRGTLPDHVQQVDQYLQEGGDQFLFNWNNDHLANLWVRRAIVAAVDWYDVGTNGWGAEGSVANEYHIGMTAPLAETHFSQSFLDSLYTYPMEADREQAAAWLERAGYTGSIDEGWVSPEGDELVLTLDSNIDQREWINALLTIQAHLRQVGIEVDYLPFSWDDWQPRYAAEVNEYELGLFWTPDPTPWDFYDCNGQWWTQPIAGGDPESGWPGDVDPDDYSDRDNHGRPFEQEIPTETGSIEAPDEAGRQPSLDDGELISIPQLTNTLRAAETTEAEFDEALETLARYANFYLPLFTFHSYTYGYWGNVRDFTFPDEGHPANLVWKEFGNDEYLTLAGLIQFD